MLISVLFISGCGFGDEGATSILLGSIPMDSVSGPIRRGVNLEGSLLM